jgi:hypothetical protein
MNFTEMVVLLKEGKKMRRNEHDYNFYIHMDDQNCLYEYAVTPNDFILSGEDVVAEDQEIYV